MAVTVTIVAISLAFLALLWVLTTARRRSIRTYLLATGTQTRATASLVRRKGKRAPVIAARYTDLEGVTRTALKSIVSAGDSELVKKPAMVVYHPRRADRDEYVLLGFGERPTRWFRVDFAKAAGDVSSVGA
jgi:hypothetical protein